MVQKSCDRERSRERDGGRSRSYNNDRRERSDRSEDVSRSKVSSNISSNLGTEDWSDDDIADIGNDETSSSDVHKNVAEELANFDKQFLPSGNK